MTHHVIVHCFDTFASYGSILESEVDDRTMQESPSWWRQSLCLQKLQTSTLVNGGAMAYGQKQRRAPLQSSQTFCGVF